MSLYLFCDFCFTAKPVLNKNGSVMYAVGPSNFLKKNSLLTMMKRFNSTKSVKKSGRRWSKRTLSEKRAKRSHSRSSRSQELESPGAVYEVQAGKGMVRTLLDFISKGRKGVLKMHTDELIQGMYVL